MQCSSEIPIVSALHWAAQVKRVTQMTASVYAGIAHDSLDKVSSHEDDC
jgi:hypothetical protein